MHPSLPDPASPLSDDGAGAEREGPRPLGPAFGQFGERARAVSTRVARWIARSSYMEKWIVLGVLIGAVAGLGAIVFYEALVGCTHLFFGVLAGYRVPTPVGEGHASASAAAARPW